MLRAVKNVAARADRLIPPARGVVVLVYHRVGGGSGMELEVPVDAFRRQMEFLAVSGRVRTLDRALEIVSGPEPQGPDPVVVTFDDGTSDLADVALPVLERYRIPAVLYVATDHVERGIWFPGGGRPLSWAALADMAATGLVTVGSHTHSHALMDRFPPDEVERELDVSIELVAEHLGEKPEHFAYPKAVPGSEFADRAVRERFRSAVLGGGGVNRYGRTDPHRLARASVQASDSHDWFVRKLDGGLALEGRLRRAANRWRYRKASR
jgi:peptidoglycan/xylan/chitin deacetylase (PgdA/CDA1 family)